MWVLVNSIFDNLPPLKSKKDPVVALLLGFFCGGIGLGIYFQSLLDFFLPLVITLVFLVAIPGAGVIVGAIIAAIFGLVRVLTSNARLGT